MSRDLPMLVIYERPTDYPHGFVIRRWIVKLGSPEPMSGELLAKDLPSLDAARAFVPPGMFNLGRMPDDDPKIVEVWI